jgi:hypothetical protein
LLYFSQSEQLDPDDDRRRRSRPFGCWSSGCRCRPRAS